MKVLRVLRELKDRKEKLDLLDKQVIIMSMWTNNFWLFIYNHVITLSNEGIQGPIGINGDTGPTGQAGYYTL